MSSHIHLIAICGTAMGTLAGMLKAKGFFVTGSDENVYPPMSEMLAQYGIPIQKGFKPENLIPSPDLVIIGNAVSKTNPEVEAVLRLGIRYLSLPQALSEFFLKEKKSLVVAGTHGKTTTTSLLAWVLKDLGAAPSFLVGGIPKNFGASYELGNGNYFVIEGDEYDTAFFDKGPKFWHYRPYQAILTGVEFDHADIYRDLDHLMQSFARFIELIDPEGALTLCGENRHALSLIKHARCRVILYGFNPDCEIRAQKILLRPEGVSFELWEKNQCLGNFISPLAGRHNLLNALGVIALVKNLLTLTPDLKPAGLNDRVESDVQRREGDPPISTFLLQKIQKAIGRFEGVKRRQEVRGVVRGITVLDDFAHHPTAVAETIAAIRGRYPERKIWAIFEPRSNTSRRAVFQSEFARAFLNADETLVAKVFMPERVRDAPLLHIPSLIQEICRQGGKAHGPLTVDEILSCVVSRANSGDVVLIMSNGGFENIHDRLLHRLA